MLVKKITTGFVVQVFDTETEKFISQEFTAGDSEYETLVGEYTTPFNQYLSFDMKQPSD